MIIGNPSISEDVLDYGSLNSVILTDVIIKIIEDGFEPEELEDE
jgi:hypothetical protein